MTCRKIIEILTYKGDYIDDQVGDIKEIALMIMAYYIDYHDHDA